MREEIIAEIFYCDFCGALIEDPNQQFSNGYFDFCPKCLGIQEAIFYENI